MKIVFICIGKTGKSFLEAGEKEYLDRLKHYCKVERIEIPDLKNAKKLTFEQIKQKEGEVIMSKLEPNQQVILLDEKGKHYSSMQFADFLQKKMNQGIKSLAFIVGGAYGFSEELYQRADGKLSISNMTFSHQMIRMIFFEQLYRAHTILKGEPYHHEWNIMERISFLTIAKRTKWFTLIIPGTSTSMLKALCPHCYG